MRLYPRSTVLASLQEFDFTSEDLSDQGYFGRGAYGTVNKMYHEQSDTMMAVKVNSVTDLATLASCLSDIGFHVG